MRIKILRGVYWGPLISGIAALVQGLGLRVSTRISHSNM